MPLSNGGGRDLVWFGDSCFQRLAKRCRQNWMKLQQQGIPNEAILTVLKVHHLQHAMNA